MWFFFTPLLMHEIFLEVEDSINSLNQIQKWLKKKKCFLTSFEGSILSPNVRPGNNGPCIYGRNQSGCENAFFFKWDFYYYFGFS